MDPAFPEPASPSVRRLVPEDVAALSVSLAKAFYDDPVSGYLFPNEGRRQRRLERYFRFQIHTVFLPFGECWTTTDLAGAALWMPPGRQPPTVREVLGQLPIITILGRQTGRAIRLVEMLERFHPQTPHYYLGTIGTDPERQRRGVGTALLDVVLARCDEVGQGAYLESSKAENLAFYHQHGFEVVKQVTIPETALGLWLMWREPQGPHT